MELCVAAFPEEFVFLGHAVDKLLGGDGPIEFVGVAGEEGDDGLGGEAVLGAEVVVGEECEEGVGVEEIGRGGRGCGVC